MVSPSRTVTASPATALLETWAFESLTKRSPSTATPSPSMATTWSSPSSAPWAPFCGDFDDLCMALWREGCRVFWRGIGQLAMMSSLHSASIPSAMTARHCWSACWDPLTTSSPRPRGYRRPAGVTIRFTRNPTLRRSQFTRTDALSPEG